MVTIIHYLCFFLQPFYFGGLHKRDECYDAICQAGATKFEELPKDMKNLPWSKNVIPKKHFITKIFHPFSLADVYEDSD